MSKRRDADHRLVSARQRLEAYKHQLGRANARTAPGLRRRLAATRRRIRQLEAAR